MDSKTKILWIGPHDSPNISGEVIYDKRLVNEVAPLFQIETYLPPKVSRLRELISLLLGASWYRARFTSKKTISEIQLREKNVDIVVCSWEHFDIFSHYVNKPTLLILHNITSTSLPTIFPGSALFRFMGRRARKHEQVCYTQGHVRALFALSQDDCNELRKLCTTAPVLWAPPGAPPAINLASSAIFTAQIVLSGSYGWWVKRRDLELFLSDIQDRPAWRIASDDALPPDAVNNRVIEKANFKDIKLCEREIRIGVIADRFESGHKLKAMFYIANNCIVLSYADIRQDFEGIPGADQFIRIVSGREDIEQALMVFNTAPSDQLRLAFGVFKKACLERFSWRTAGNALTEEISRIEMREATD